MNDRKVVRRTFSCSMGLDRAIRDRFVLGSATGAVESMVERYVAGAENCLADLLMTQQDLDLLCQVMADPCPHLLSLEEIRGIPNALRNIPTHHAEGLRSKLSRCRLHQLIALAEAVETNWRAKPRNYIPTQELESNHG